MDKDIGAPRPQLHRFTGHRVMHGTSAAAAVQCWHCHELPQCPRPTALAPLLPCHHKVLCRMGVHASAKQKSFASRLCCFFRLSSSSLTSLPSSYTPSNDHDHSHDLTNPQPRPPSRLNAFTTIHTPNTATHYHSTEATPALACCCCLASVFLHTLKSKKQARPH